MNWSLMMIFYLLFSSVFFVMSSNSPLLLWMSFEMNLLLMLMFIFEKKMNLKSMTCYFIFQSFGSYMFIFGFLNNFWFFLSIIGLFIKLGIFPFHIWQPYVFSFMSWKLCMILAGPQKLCIIYLFFWMNLIWSSMIMSLFVVTIMVSNINLFFFLDLKKAFAFLSIGTTSWLLLTSNVYEQLTLYLFLYNIQLFIFFLLFFYMDSIFLENEKMNNWSILIFMITYSGIPPFLGFFMKTQVIVVFMFLMKSSLLIFMLALTLLPSIIYMIYYSLSFISYNISFLMKKWGTLSSFIVLILPTFIFSFWVSMF